MHTILVTRKLDPVVITKLSETCTLDIWDEDTAIPRQELLKRIVGKDAVLCLLTDKIDSEVLDAAGSNLKVVSTMSVGYDHVDIAACRARGIKVGFTPDVLTDSVADLSIALMLNGGRRLPEAASAARSGEWGEWRPYWMTGIDLYGATVGIAGMGRIGIAVVERLKGFNCKIVYTARTAKPELDAKYGIRKVEFDELLDISDFITIHAPLTPDTQNLFSADQFSKMKPTSVLVNTSRGGLVDQDALVNALQTKQIYSAALDVTSPEPLPTDHPLFSLPNCLVLPHIGSASVSTRQQMGQLSADNLLAGLTDQPMPYQVPQ